ncbi:hypothetical protein GLI01_23570 [Gluconacetobacter liquefaciens]|uniref:TubC N-terminal docking domain-containing protein n=1 Tax=Gluconacetobacter liquefaciens TaxID=89584 RepID=A0A370G322_GLULI|nr:hypothetical protein [Gluconacetobacter liquefaciens]RDI38145.1 hypothetical protein C7453_10482 [Gluconacetobacter liquefaciens]GBR09453.1 hypothetical protein AA0522_2332 [Gluconacetobacter liquefaciens NRIC 0522]GEB38322.1 hypothetical protein GLI01_23570 [Gluconacetobacter liquefaciens]
MVSPNLLRWAEDQAPTPSDPRRSAPIDLAAVTDDERAAALAGNSRGVIRELEWCGATVLLKDGVPVIKGAANVEPETMVLAREYRREIAIVLDCWAREWLPPRDPLSADDPASVSAAADNGNHIERDPVTAKLRIIGEAPDERWLTDRGWTWCRTRHRWMAPYPHDVADPTPEWFVQLAPRQSVNGKSAPDMDPTEVPCSLCGLAHWWRRHDVSSREWVCRTCHPPPPGIGITAPRKEIGTER